MGVFRVDRAVRLREYRLHGIERLTRGFELEIPAYKYSTLFPSLAEPRKK